MPSAYAALLALVLRRWALAPPAWLLKPVGLLAQASVPIFLLLLGIQLAEMFFVPRWSLLLWASLIKLGLAPCLAYYLSILLHLDPLSRNTLVLAAASPTAIVTTMLAVEFDAQPDLVSSLTLVTTMASTFTLPYILHCLK